jgi:sucrose phosphorylase
VVDVAGLLTDDEIDFVRAKVDEITLPAQPYMKFPSMIKTSGKQAQRVSANVCSYYSALGADDRAYCWARAVQFLRPHPASYYVGLLAERRTT